MNLDTFQRGQVVAFAYRAARHTGSLDCMKAICYILRNRIRAGWGDGTWISVIALQRELEGNTPEQEAPLDLTDRLLQMLVRDIDDIYLGVSDDETRGIVEGTMGGEPGRKAQAALYYHFIDQEPTQWFVENIARRPNDHPRIAHIHTLAMYG